jgi:molybdate transport system ATP-binding protein
MAAAVRKKRLDVLLHCRLPLAQFELDIDASFEARLTAIFGPSGSGKTTILDANAGVKEIAEGEIEVNGRTLVSSARHINLSPRQKFVGYLPQEGALFPHLLVRQNILFGADRSTVFDKFKDISLDHVVNVLEIANLLDRRVTALSGGERRESHSRVRLSRPQILLIDEPLAALDVGLKERILPFLARVRDEFAML